MTRIRIAAAEDAPVIAAIYAPYVLETAISFEETPPLAGEMSQRITSALQSYPFLVFESEGEVVGYAYGGPHGGRPAYRWSANVSVYTASDAHRRGIGRALYTTLLDLLDRQGFHSIFAGIAHPNDKSVGLHEAMGFTRIGVYDEVGFKFGRWHDVGYWRRGLRIGLPTSEPIPFPELDLGDIELVK